MKARNHILPLTGLRFCAAFYVFLFHIHIRWPLTHNFFLKNILDQGAIAMSVFFMLSGLLLSYNYTDLKYSYKEYFVNRFSRIYPVYLVAALITLPLFGVGLENNSYLGMIKSFLQILFLIFTNIFLIQACFPPLFNYWNDCGSWSISVEMFLYLILPFVLPIFLKYDKKKLFLTIFLFYILSILPGICVSLFNNPSNNVFYSMPIFRLPEFLIGVCLYLVMRSISISEYRRNVFQVGSITIFFLYLGMLGLKLPMYVGHNWITIPLISFLIFSLASGKGIISSLLSIRLFVWLGKISYCFYSFQILMFFVLIDNHEKIVDFTPVLKNNLALTLVSFLFLVIVSAIGYCFIEEPARRWIKVKFN
jgi:peptidoglycan/LPS O-acetylase OafA/YrhL